MAHPVPASIRLAVLLTAITTGLGACDRASERATVAIVQSAGFQLLPDYPADVQAGDRVLPRSLIARGDSLYHRMIGVANCIMCHGEVLEGGSRGTNLRDGDWHHGDGSFDFLVAITTSGVERSLASPISEMPPMGGIRLPHHDVEALAAYVYWIAGTAPRVTVEHPGDYPRESVLVGSRPEGPAPMEGAPVAASPEPGADEL